MDEKETSWIYRLIRWFVRLFSPKFQVIGAERLPDGPCVIVGNHSQMYGPIAGELYTPGKHYIWCAGEMMHPKEVPAYAFADFWSGKPKAFHWFFRLLSHMIVPLSVCIFTNAHTIPVYHDARLRSTFRESIARLQEGSTIVIFPEHHIKHNNILCDFQDKFIDLARLYYKKTGEELNFVPMYLAPKRKEMIFGDAVRYCAAASIAEERRRICETLMDRITQIAVGLPEHTVVPYPNMPKKDYPKNIPLEVYAHEKTTC